MLPMEMNVKSVEKFHTIIEDGFYRSEAYSPNRATVQQTFQLVRSMTGQISVARYRGGDLGVRRTWTHIRALSSEQYVIWFPVQGKVSITQDAHQDEGVGVDDFVITCGDRPFHIIADSLNTGQCSQILIQVPSHLMRTYLPNVNQICGRKLDARRGSARIAREMFRGLVDEAKFMPDLTATRLGLVGLDSLMDSIKREVSDELSNVDIKKTQFDLVKRYIDQHISAPGLTADKVATGCGISRRYLHYLMHDQHTTFAAYLWETRFSQAKKWLLDPEFSHFSISEIAYMSGFRTASHFSSAYRIRYGITPRDARWHGSEGEKPLH